MNITHFRKPPTMLILILVLFIPFTLSQPSEQYSKVFLQPFYVNSMIQNVDYNYVVDVRVPDGMSSIKSGILTLKAYINPTRTFYAKVNGQYCSNNYTVSTTYASASQAEITFDCSRQIVMNSLNNVTISVSGGNIGASTSWLDMTYANNPKGSMNLQGTQYNPNEFATMFLQVTNNQDLPINNASCYLNMWAPKNTSNIHPQVLTNSPMLPAIGNEGIYYYDMVTPNISGVYMLSARCSYSYDWVWIYSSDDVINHPTRQIITGTCDAMANQLNSPFDSEYELCNGNSVQINYTFNITQYGSLSNITNINIYYSGESPSTVATLTMAYFNGTGFVNLPNTLSYSGTGDIAGPTGVDEYLTNSLPLNSIQNNSTITVRMSFTGNNIRFYNNWLSISLLSSLGTVENLKGSSEMVVSTRLDEVNRSINSNIDITRSQLNTSIYDINRSINTNVDNTRAQLNTSIYNINQTINANIDNTRTQLNSSIYAINQSINSNIDNTRSNLTSQISLVPSNVWNFNTRNLTYYQDVTNYSLINSSIQSAKNDIVSNVVSVNNTLLSVNNSLSLKIDNVLTNITSQLSNILSSVFNVPFNVWNFTTRNLTYYQNFTVPQVDMTNYTLIPIDVWNFTTRNLTYYQNFSSDMTNYTLIRDNQFNYSGRFDNVDNGIINITSGINVVNNTLNNVPSSVWNYSTRNLTFYPSQSDLTNYTMINEGVWSYVGRYIHGIILN